MKSIDIGAESVLVEQIRVNGNYFTLPSFIEAELGRHGIKKDSSLSLRSLFGSCEAASQSLSQLEPLRSARIQINPSSQSDRSVIVDVALDEKIFFGAGVHANPTSNSFVEGGTRVRLRNIFGVCDVLNFSWDESTNKDSLLHFEHSFPRLLMGRSASFSINQGVENLAFSSSTSIKSTTASIAMQSLFSKGDNLSLNASLRDVVPTEFDGKVMSRTSALQSMDGSSFKSSVIYSMVRGNFDSPSSPTRGFVNKFTKEIALPPGDATFLKSTAQSRLMIPLNNNIVMLPAIAFTFLSNHGGVVVPLTFPQFSEGKIGFYDDASKVKFPEKIRSSDVRGFRPLSIGPRDQEDVIGGDTSISGTVALVSKFPRSSPDNPFRFHVFANSGSVIDRDLSRSVLENLQLLNAANRISLGAGVLANMGAFQAELNFIHPVKFLSADKPRYFELRFQLGM